MRGLRERKPAVIGATALILAAFIPVFVIQVHDGYRRSLSDASDIVAMITQVVNDHAYRAFGAVEDALERAQFEVTRSTGALDGNKVDATLVREIAVLDGRGIVSHSTTPGSVGAQPFDRGLLDRARAQPNTMVFGPIRHGRSLGDQGEQAARSQRHLLPVVMAGPNGTLVAAAVNPSYFSDIYTPIATVRVFSIALATYDGVVVATSADSPLATGQSLAGSPPFDGSIQRQQSGRLDEADHGRELMAYRSTPQFPFVTLVGVRRETVLQDWRRQTILLSSILALVVASMLVGAALLVRQLGIRDAQRQRLADAERVEKTNQLLSAIVDAPASLTAIMTPELDIVQANPLFKSILGSTTRSLRPVLQRPTVSGGDKLTEFAAAGPEPGADREILLSLAQGNNKFTVLRFQVSWRNIPDIGHCLVLVGTDETTHRAAQAAIAQSAKMITLGEMATGMAHELNQPINIIGMAAQNALGEIEPMKSDDPLPLPTPELLEFLASKFRTILSQTKRAASLISHMRVFGRVPKEAATLFDAGMACTGVLDLIGQQVRARNIALDVDPGPGPATILGHQTMLEQVLINIVINARDALSTVTGREKRIEVRCRVEGRTVVIEIDDNGPGIPDGIRDRIFDPFFTTKDVGQGTGLGLALSYGIVKDMNGSISAVPSDVGARIRIELPEAR